MVTTTDPVESRRIAALLHARTRSFRQKLDDAARILDRWLSVCRSPAVEFSGGKDSHVVLDLVRDRVPDAPALHGDDEWYLPESEELLASIPGLVRIRRRLTHTEWFVAWAEMDGPDGGGKHRWALSHEVDGVASGLRADENSRRRAEIAIHGTCYQLANGLWRVYPVARWSVLDIWAYLLSRSIRYNRAYDRLAEIGVDLRHQRIGPFASERAVAYGQLVILKRGWPNLYRRFVARYPEASQYA